MARKLTRAQRDILWQLVFKSDDLATGVRDLLGTGYHKEKAIQKASLEAAEIARTLTTLAKEDA